MQPLRAESYTAAQVRTFALGELSDALSECIEGLIALGKEEVTAEIAVASIEASWERQDGRFSARSLYRAELIEAKCDVRCLHIRSRVLTQVKTIIQTQCRSIA